MAEPSEYVLVRLDDFMERYDEGVRQRDCQAMVWAELPPGVKEALTAAFTATATQIERELY